MKVIFKACASTRRYAKIMLFTHTS